MRPVAILGAGIAGLTAAEALRRRGLPFILFEAGNRVGGLASSFKDAQGFTYDFGAHFVNNRLAEALGAASICRTVTYYGESVRLGARSCAYPLGLLRSPRFVASALLSRLQPRPVDNAEDWFRQRYGDALAEQVAIPLAEAWSGVPATELAASVGQKMRAGALKAAYLTAAARLTGRAVCNGYSHELPESPGVYHVYPEGGIARLLEPMALRAAPHTRLGSPVESILVDDGRVVAVRVGGTDIEVSAAISTAPVNVLPKLVKGSDAVQHLSAFRYRPMVFVNLRFEGRGLIPDTMLWVPDRSYPFYRITEAPISMPWLAPEGKTQITFDIGCHTGDAMWTMPDEKLAALCLDGFCDLFPAARAKYIGAAGVLRTPISYPVHLNKYEAQRRLFAETTGIDGLYSVGRNGEFAHLLMEDVYQRTLKRVGDVAAYVTGQLVRREGPDGTADAMAA